MIHSESGKVCSGQIARKWMWKFQKNVKIKSPILQQNYFFLESFTIEPSENDDSIHDSKYIRNYMQPNFMCCQKIVLYVKWLNGVIDVLYFE